MKNFGYYFLDFKSYIFTKHRYFLFENNNSSTCISFKFSKIRPLWTHYNTFAGISRSFHHNFKVTRKAAVTISPRYFLLSSNSVELVKK
ncbi:hypothetical protein WN943_023813 [Citrus x changshan-huyou]